MAAAYQIRIDRLRRLEALLPDAATAPVRCPDGGGMLEVLADAYAGDNPTSRRRALQRDLDALVQEGRIEVVNPSGKPLRYRRRADNPEADPLIRAYTLQQVRDLVAEAIPERRLDWLWQRLRNHPDGPLLDEQCLRSVPDTLRLRPVELSEPVLQAVIRSLAQHLAVKALYENAEGERGEAVIHPQALVQRGPIPYLFALKNDEDEPVRLYALHRMIRADVLAETPARRVPGFDLDEQIAQGKADFGRGEMVDLEIRVRGYLAGVLPVCPLSRDQRWEDEPEASDFELRVHARVPSTGQLLRWLLGAGDNLEVVAPAELRRVVAVQAAKVAALYQEA